MYPTPNSQLPPNSFAYESSPMVKSANMPPERNRKEPICFSPYHCRARNLVERFFNKIKQCRRIATCYDKRAANYLAFIKLACIRIWLRACESTPLRFCAGS